MPDALRKSTRDMTEHERAKLDAHCSKYAADGAANRGLPMELLVPGLGLLVLGGVLRTLGAGVGPFFAAGGALLVAGAAALWWRRRSTEPRRHWAADSNRAVETWLDARRVVFTLDDRGDGQLYAFVELSDDSWQLIVDEHLAYAEDLLDTLSRERIGWCETDLGYPLWVCGEGARIPSRGVRDLSSEGIETAIDQGFCWSPDTLAEDSVDADDLPEWMVDWSLEPPAPDEP